MFSYLRLVCLGDVCAHNCVCVLCFNSDVDATVFVYIGVLCCANFCLFAQHCLCRCFWCKVQLRLFASVSRVLRFLFCILLVGRVNGAIRLLSHRQLYILRSLV